MTGLRIKLRSHKWWAITILPVLITLSGLAFTIGIVSDFIREIPRIFRNLWADIYGTWRWSVMGNKKLVVTGWRTWLQAFSKKNIKGGSFE